MVSYEEIFEPLMREDKGNEIPIRVGHFEPGAQVYIQQCRKCRMHHESTHILVRCQNHIIHCNGTMSAVLDFFECEKT
jgi:hypothetical protein